LDPQDERETAFVSHAHSDHIGNHREVILSETTAKLMAARLPGRRVEHALPFRSPMHFRGATVTLLPAGHIFGSAQIHIQLASFETKRPVHCKNLTQALYVYSPKLAKKTRLICPTF
jgi:Cft2 family RNA processing exonuclease